MTLLFCDGFDNMGTTDGVTYGKYLDALPSANSGSSATRALVTGRFGTRKAMQFAATWGASGSITNYNRADLKSDFATIFVGFALREDTAIYANSNAVRIFVLQDNTQSNQLDIRWNSSHLLTVTRNGTVLCTSSASNSSGVWYWIELAALISPTIGWTELRQNGTLVASYYGTGTSRATANGNTRASSVSSVRYIMYGLLQEASGGANPETRSFDDIVVNDNNGSVNNDFLGDTDVVGLLPSTNGTNSNLTRVGGSAGGNYTAVNDNPIDGDTSYVVGGAAGLLDTYVFPALPNTTSSILGVVFQPVAKKDGSGARTVTSHQRHTDSTEADVTAAALTLSASYQTAVQVQETNPRTNSAWNINDLTGEFGPKILS